MASLGRLLTAMVTPFDKNGGVDYAAAKRLAQALVDSGSDGVVVSGTTGESPTLTHDEKLRLFSEIRQALGSRYTVIAGTGSYNTAESAELSRAAEKTGVDGVLLVVPYYNKPTQEGLYQHFKHIAERTKLPCILYNVPSRTITSIAPETVVRLSKAPNIVGIKEASGNFDNIGAIIRDCPKGFLVYSGNDSDTFKMMAMGGYGVISVSAHLVGKQTKEMMDKVLKGDSKGAEEIHQRLLPFINALFVVSNPIPVKYALNKVGFSVGGYRLPLTPPDSKAAAAIDEALAKVKVDLPVQAAR